MNLAPWLPALTTAFLAGLLGGGHCFGMCGGIAGGLGAMGVRDGRAAFGSAVLFNAGRIFSYAVLGGVAALVLGATGDTLGIPAWSRWLRLATGLLILAVGLRFLFEWQGLAAIERAGAGLWRRVAPLAQRAARHPGAAGRLLLGLCWGLLPCGLVYTVLLTAASTGHFAAGCAVMLAFGAGTLPALMGLTLAAPALAALLGDRPFRRLIGAALVLLAAWSIVLLVPGGGAHSH